MQGCRDDDSLISCMQIKKAYYIFILEPYIYLPN